MHIKNYRFVALIAGMLILIPAYGQKMVNSPYARFNLGMLEPAYNFRSAGMGGVSVSLKDNTSVSWTNPASYASLDTNSFVFDFGIDYTAAYLKDRAGKHFSDDMNFDHLVISFPLAKGWGFTAGILPYSNGYYYISRKITEDDPEYDPLTGVMNITHKGMGSLNRAFLGTGVTLIPNLAAGVNMSVLFGELSRINEYYFESDPTSFISRKEENMIIRGFGFETGLQYTINLEDRKSITPGISWSIGSEYKSSYSDFFMRFSNYGQPPYSPDTITITEIPDGRIRLPQTISAGISYNIRDKLTAAAEFTASDWDNAQLYGSSNMLASTTSFRAGIEYIPERGSIYNYLRRLEYRLGGHLSDNYLFINGEQIKEFGITFGIGFPMPRSWSKINIFADWNSRAGSLNSGLHRENCFSFGLSLNLYDYWFLKAKYE
ncbi:MAG: hypothetical protein R6W67_06465 [Bacteroidales bacterium]